MDKIMTEHPILFNSEMVRAILDGRKTQTRRIVKPQPPESAWPIHDSLDCYQGEGWAFQYPKDIGGGLVYNAIFELPNNGKPKYQVGDKLWVRETWFQKGRWYSITPESESYAWQRAPGKDGIFYAADGTPPKIIDNSFYPDGWRKRPSIHMPKWATRIWLEITSIRVEKVRDISAEDAKAEGVTLEYVSSRPSMSDYIHNFKRLWDSINKKRGFGWDVNPWVWVIGFKVIPK